MTNRRVVCLCNEIMLDVSTLLFLWLKMLHKIDASWWWFTGMLVASTIPGVTDRVLAKEEKKS